MRTLIGILVIFSSISLFGCGEARVVLECVAPEIIVETDGIDISGGISIKKAKGDIGVQLGSKLTAEFAKADASSWNYIASTYQYQTCQVVNSTGCGDLSPSDCRSEKQQVLDSAFDKINREINASRERLEKANKQARQESIRACIADKVALHQTDKTKQVEGGARAQGPGWKGGRKTDEKTVCISVGPNQQIKGGTTSNTCCHGGRCSVTEPMLSDGNRKICVETKAWSESKSGGGGGCAKYRLTATYFDVATEQIKSGFEAVCSAKSS
ncbi:MAG: hypothetical protein ABW124_13030 [Candidatus Thiodiazotropha sp. 6PLUC9]